MKSPRELTSARKNIGNSSDRKQQAEQFVADHVGKLHGSLLYGVDQAGSIDEVASRADQRAEEHRQFFRHDGEIGVQDHQHVAASGAEASPDILGFTAAGPLSEANAFIRV